MTPSARLSAGCDPAVFAEEIANYIARAEEHKAEAATRRERKARKPRKKARSKSIAVTEPPAQTASSSYWDWDPAPAATSSSSAPPTSRRNRRKPPGSRHGKTRGMYPKSRSSASRRPRSRAWSLQKRPRSKMSRRWRQNPPDRRRAADGGRTSRGGRGIRAGRDVDPIAALLFKPATPTAADLVANAVVHTNDARTIEEIDLSSFLYNEPAAAPATSDPEHLYAGGRPVRPVGVEFTSRRRPNPKPIRLHSTRCGRIWIAFAPIVNRSKSP